MTTHRLVEPFVDALLMEIETYAEEYAALEPVETIYFGGGTPSLLPLQEVERILMHVHLHFDTATVREITFEVNPEDVTWGYMRGLFNLGITRVSVGIQSFFADDLAFMRRIHSAEQAEATLPIIRKAGFRNISADLIFGIPDQSPEHWAANLEKMVKTKVPHISTYGLTVEEKTPLYKMVQHGRVLETDEETMAERYQFTVDYLAQHGYEHYEISSFAQPGNRSQHNQLYWCHKNYLGFGPSAHSFWRFDLPEAGARRWANVRNLTVYQRLLRQYQRPLDHRERLSTDTLADEYILLRLRTADGLHFDELETRYGVDLLTEKVDALAYLEASAYIHPIRNGRIHLTTAGQLLCDSVIAKLTS